MIFSESRYTLFRIMPAARTTRHPEVLAKRASKDERPRCCSRAVALRDGRFAASFRMTVKHGDSAAN
jgi:hypothetical protein